MREAGSGHIIDILRSTIERCPILLKYCPLLEKGLNRREGEISGGPFSKKVSFLANIERFVPNFLDYALWVQHFSLILREPRVFEDLQSYLKKTEIIIVVIAIGLENTTKHSE